MRRPLVGVVLLYAGGVLLGRFCTVPLVWLFLATAFSLMGAWWHRQHQRQWLALALIFAGWTNLAFHTTPLSPHDLRSIVGEDAVYATVRGRLHSAPRVYGVGDEERLIRTVAVLEVESLCTEDRSTPVMGRMMTSTAGQLPPEYFRGRSVRVTGVVRLPSEAKAKELFDYRQYLADRGIYYELQCRSLEDWESVQPAPMPSGPPWPDRFQHWAQQALARGLPEDEASVRLLWAMLLGWRAGLTDDLAQEFRRSGTMHVFAISGLHIGLITVILVALCRTSRVPRGRCWMVVIPALWFYAAATGWQSSAVRATLMSSVVLAGWSLRRPQDLLNSLAGAAWLILLWDPLQLFQVGFQLSFSVVLAIVLMLPHLDWVTKRWLAPEPLVPEALRSKGSQWRTNAARKILGSFGISLAATLGSMPWMAYYFHICTPISLAANLVVVPLAAVALMSGLGSLLTAAWFPYASILYNHSAWLAMVVMTVVSRWAAALPGAWSYVASPSTLLLCGYFLCLIGMAAKSYPYWNRTRLTVLGIGAGLLATALVQEFVPAGIQIAVLPLRGGDSIYIDAPGSAHDLLVDTGDEPASKQVVEPFLRARGVNRLQNLVLTHGDVRHVGGAAHVRKAFQVKTTLTSSIRSRSPAYRSLLKELEQTKVDWRQLERQDDVCGWRVLHPVAEDRFGKADDNALVLLGEFEGVRVLLASDLGRLGQQALLNREPTLKVDVIIAGMPGSDEPLNNNFLCFLEPQIVIISAGEYPANERPSRTLRERLNEQPFPVLFTSDHGAINLTLRQNQWRVQAHDGRIEYGRQRPGSGGR